MTAVAPGKAGPGADSKGETRIEHDDGYLPGRGDEEIPPAGETASEESDGA